MIILEFIIGLISVVAEIVIVFAVVVLIMGLLVLLKPIFFIIVVICLLMWVAMVCESSVTQGRSIIKFIKNKLKR